MALSSALAATVMVDCDAGDDSAGCGSAAQPCRTIAHALPLAGSGQVLVSAPATQRCELASTLVVGEANSGVTIEAKDELVTLSGGRALDATMFSPVSKYPDVAAQIQSPSARAAAMVADLPSAINATTATCGEQWAQYFLGGSGCIYPGRIVPTGMRFFVGGAWQFNAGWPRPSTAVGNITRIDKIVKGRTMEPSWDMQARMESWADQFASPKPDVVARGWWNGIGWAVTTLNVTAYTAPQDDAGGTLTIGPGLVDESDLHKGGYFTVLNVLAELAEPGDWYLNRTSGLLVVVPPEGGFAPPGPAGAAPPESSGPPTVSVLRSAVVRVEGASDVSLVGFRVAYGNGPGVQAVNSTSFSMLSSTVENVGMMAVNVSGGAGALVSDVEVGATGSGGVFLFGGDRITLTPAGHTVQASRIHGFSLLTQAYAPGIYLEGVGNAAVGVEVFDATHECVYVQGNDHSILRSDIHHCTQKTRDSGAVYMGRDWSARGHVIRDSSFHDIDTHIDGPGGDVQAIYFDDMYSGVTVENCTFTNVSRTLLLGGGRNNRFVGNRVVSPPTKSTPVRFDDRGEGWSKASCQPGGLLQQLLDSVPYNTSSVWRQSYPALVDIMSDEPCLPKYNVIANNTYCGVTGGLIDQTAATITKWGSSASGNAVQC